MGRSPDHAGFGYRRVELSLLADQQRDPQKILVFLEEHGGIDARDEYQRTALMHFCLRPHIVTPELAEFYLQMAQILLAEGADFNLADKEGYTALNFAVQEGVAGAVGLLLSRPELDLHPPRSPLTTALFYRLEDCQELLSELLERGFSPFEKPCADGCSPLEILLQHQTGKIRQPAADMTQVLEWIHERYPAELPQVPPFYLTLLQFDYLTHQFEMVFHTRKASALMQFLEEHGGVDAKNEQGETALNYCMRPEHDRKLYGRFAPMRRFANQFAAKLLARGANPQLPDRAGELPADRARVSQNVEMLALLTAEKE